MQADYDSLQMFEQRARKFIDEGNVLILAELCPTCYGILTHSTAQDLKLCTCDNNPQLRYGRSLLSTHGLESLYVEPQRNSPYNPASRA